MAYIKKSDRIKEEIKSEDKPSTATFTFEEQKVAKETGIDKLLSILDDINKSISDIRKEQEQIRSEIDIIKSYQSKGVEDEDGKELKQERPFSLSSPELDNIKPDLSDEFQTIPVNIRKEVDEILGKSFDIKIVPNATLPNFAFSIIVPDKYKDITVQKDVRTKIVSNAEGLNGIRDWCNKVKNNLMGALTQANSITKQPPLENMIQGNLILE